MKWWEKFLHRHTFDPNTWKLLEKTKLYPFGVDPAVSLPIRSVYCYSNTCLTCGDLVRNKLEF